MVQEEQPQTLQAAVDQVAPQPEQAPLPRGQAQPQESPLPVISKYERDEDDPTLDKGSDVGAAVALANEKTKKQRKTNADGIPVDLAPRWELIVDEATKAIKIKRDEIKMVIGEKPYKGIPIDEDEAQRRYVQMRKDVELQTQALEPNIQKAKDGRIMINKEYIKKLIEFETKIRKGEILT